MNQYDSFFLRRSSLETLYLELLLVSESSRVSSFLKLEYPMFQLWLILSNTDKHVEIAVDAFIKAHMTWYTVPGTIIPHIVNPSSDLNILKHFMICYAILFWLYSEIHDTNSIFYFTILSTIVLLILSNFITPSFHSGVGHLPGLSSLSWADLGEKIWKKFSFIKSNLMWNVGTVFYFFQHWNKLCYCPIIQ